MRALLRSVWDEPRPPAAPVRVWRDWVLVAVRGYAIAQGAGTQFLTAVFWLLFVGKPEGLSRALLMAASWVINIGVAEWIIRKQITPARLPR